MATRTGADRVPWWSGGGGRGSWGCASPQRFCRKGGNQPHKPFRSQLAGGFRRPVVMEGPNPCPPLPVALEAGTRPGQSLFTGHVGCPSQLNTP